MYDLDDIDKDAATEDVDLPDFMKKDEDAAEEPEAAPLDVNVNIPDEDDDDNHGNR